MILRMRLLVILFLPPLLPKQRNEQQYMDRISQLPNDILVYILTFLTLVDAARTSVLSKSWMGLWMYVAGLNFDDIKMWEGIEESSKTHRVLRKVRWRTRRKYVEWVNKVLLSHKAIDLDVFRIRFDLDSSSKDDIDKWLQYALARSVHKLDLNLCTYTSIGFDDGRKSYAFPHDLLGLSVWNSPVVSPSGSCGSGFKSLRDLMFNSVAVSGSVLEFFLHNCPCLEHLVVVNSDSLEKLEVCGPSLVLKYLEIYFCFKLSSLTVRDTNIVSLRVYDGKSLVLKNVPKLVDVYIGEPRRFGDLLSSVKSILSSCPSTLEVLTLLITTNQVTQWRKQSVAVPRFTKLKQLKFVMFGPAENSLIPYTSLIWSFPNLEKLVLKICRLPASIGSSINHLYHGAKALPLQHLTVVEISGYCGDENREVELVKYLVKKGVALERTIIDPRSEPFFTYLPAGAPGPENPEEEAIFRNRAKEQLQALVPSHVELVFLLIYVHVHVCWIEIDR